MLETFLEIWRGFFRKGFVRNVFLLSSGVMINIGLNIFLTPVVTRLFDRADYGLASLFASIVNIVVLVGTFMYPTAIVLPAENETANRLAKLSFVTLTGVVVISIVGAMVITPFLDIDMQSYRYWWLLLPVGLFIMTLDQTTSALNVRAKEFKRNVNSSVLSGTLNKGITIGYGALIGSSQFGIILGFLGGHLAGSILRLTKGVAQSFYGSWNLRQLKEVAIRYLNYPRFILPGDFINRFSRDLPIYFFAAMEGLTLVGSYAFAVTMLTIPYNLIGTSVSPAFVQRAAELHKTSPHALGDFVLKINRTLLALGVVPFAILVVFGGELFAFVFSAEWREAGVFAGMLSIYFLFRLITSPMSSIFRVLEKERISFVFNIFLFVGRALVLVSVDNWWGPMNAILAFSIFSAVAYLILMIIIFRLVDRSSPLMLIRPAVSFFGVVGVLWILKWLILQALA